MISDLSRLDLSVLHVHLVTTQHCGYTITDMIQIAMPDGNVTVRHSSSHVEHDDSTLSLDVVAVSESSKFLLTRSVPHVEFDWSSGRVEDQWVDLDTYSGCVCVIWINYVVFFLGFSPSRFKGMAEGCGLSGFCHHIKAF